jgi:hypothetical protein
VLAAAELDRQIVRAAEEVEDERADRVLPAEPETYEAAAAEQTPEGGLGVGLLSAQLAAADQ